jgi:hypothetical protein
MRTGILAASYDRIRAQMYQERLAKEDPYVKLARATIESFIKVRPPAQTAGKFTAGDALAGKAGAFRFFKRARTAAWLHRDHRSHAGQYRPGNHA